MIDIDVVALDGTGACPTGATIDVFSAANWAIGAKTFDLRFVSAADTFRTRGGMTLTCTPFAKAKPRSLVIVLGLGVFLEEDVVARLAKPDAQAAVRWIARAQRLNRKVAASCTGVFLAGEAGALDGRDCVTTWWLGNVLKTRYPRCAVDATRMVVRDGPLWTAGSAFAHVDLLLALLGDLTERRVVEEVAGRLVFDTRPSQAAFMIPLHLSTRDPVVADLETAVRASPGTAHTLASLARRARTSPRTLSRRIHKALGVSPLQMVRKVRLETAVHLLKSTRLPLDEIRARVGFEDAATLHRLIKNFTGISPGALRSGLGARPAKPETHRIRDR